MICRRSPGTGFLSDLCVHEIARGKNRSKAIDKPYATLVLCGRCHRAVEDQATWPESRQLAVLKRRSPEDYDLAAYNELVNPRAPRRITPEEVEQWRIE